MVKNWNVVTTHACLLGEGPVWDAVNQCVYWVDILNGDVHKYCSGTSKPAVMHAGQMVGAIALCKNGGLIGALQHGFAFIDFVKASVKMLADPEAHLPGNRFNDGKCDPGGRFWAGTMNIAEGKRGAGSLYVLDRDLSVTVKIRDVTCSNGLAWSPDHKTFYFIDTPTRHVVAYDYDLVSGAITNRRAVIRIPEGDGSPDGMTVDSEGMLWIACWGGWKVSRWDPSNGTSLGNISLPVSQVTSCVFGGEDMADLYITTAKAGLSENDLRREPLAGCLFVIKNSGYKGVPGVRFDGVLPSKE